MPCPGFVRPRCVRRVVGVSRVLCPRSPVSRLLYSFNVRPFLRRQTKKKGVGKEKQKTVRKDEKPERSILQVRVRTILTPNRPCAILKEIAK